MAISMPSSRPASNKACDVLAAACLANDGVLPACRVPARRPGNFGVRITSLREVSEPPLREHLRPQMKVTKAKGLNTTPPSFCTLRSPGPAGHLHQCGTNDLLLAGRRGPRNASPAQARWTQGQSEARPRRVRCRFDIQRWLQVARRADIPKREERAEWFCIQGLCFGDFHLAPQMKVTRPPGRDPASRQSTVLSTSPTERAP